MERREACRQRFRGRPVTPQAPLSAERTPSVRPASVPTNVRRRIETASNPTTRKRCQNKVRYHSETYRPQQEATPLQVASKFGMITAAVVLLPERAGRRTRACAGACAFGNRRPPGRRRRCRRRVARVSVDPTQGEVRRWLLREHGPDLVQRSLACGGWRGFRRALLPVRC